MLITYGPAEQSAIAGPPAVGRLWRGKQLPARRAYRPEGRAYGLYEPEAGGRAQRKSILSVGRPARHREPLRRGGRVPTDKMTPCSRGKNMMMKNETTTVVQPPSGWRFGLGMILFVVGLICPVFILLVTATDLPGKWKSSHIGPARTRHPRVVVDGCRCRAGQGGLRLSQRPLFQPLQKSRSPG